MYTYDSNGYNTFTEQVQWNGAVGTYVPYNKTEYVNNPAGIAIDRLIYGWFLGAYEYALHSVFGLDAANRVLSDSSWRWDRTAGNWNLEYVNLYAYNPQGALASHEYKTWDGYARNKRDYYYDASGVNLVKIEFFNWNLALANWRIVDRTTNTLNSSGRLTSTLRELFNYTTSTWDSAERHTITYAPAGSGEEVTAIRESWTPSGFINTVKSVFTYNSFKQETSALLLHWVSGAWAISPNSFRNFYHYEPYTAPVNINPETSAAPELVLSPNPVSDVLHVVIRVGRPQMITGMITDMTGRIYEQFGSPSASLFKREISLEKLPSGNYILSVIGDHGQSVSRTITVVH